MILIFKSTNPAWQIKKKNIRRGAAVGGALGEEKRPRELELGAQKDRKLERKGGIMRGTQSCTSLEQLQFSSQGAVAHCIFN